MKYEDVFGKTNFPERTLNVLDVLINHDGQIPILALEMTLDESDSEEFRHYLDQVVRDKYKAASAVGSMLFLLFPGDSWDRYVTKLGAVTIEFNYSVFQGYEDDPRRILKVSKEALNKYGTVILSREVLAEYLDDDESDAEAFSRAKKQFENTH